jgi:hypothetical protein
MITGEMYDNHDLHWSARQQSIGVQPQLPLLTTQWKLFTNSRTIIRMEILNKNAITQKTKPGCESQATFRSRTELLASW